MRFESKSLPKIVNKLINCSKFFRLFQQSDRQILLQNENGPCPLLAAANALLLKGLIELPAHCIRNSVASLEDVTNMLANRAMHNHADQAHFVDELMHHIPRFQYGMDVNPKFTDGISGYEYTSELTAFDMLQVKLVHGWLVDPHQEETFTALGSKTYNEVVEWVIKGNEASGELEKLQKELNELMTKQQTLQIDLLDDDSTQNVEAIDLRQELSKKELCQDINC